MELSWTSYRLLCTHPFGISRNTHSWYDVIYVYLKDGNIIGRGEAAPSSRYNENHALLKTQLETLKNPAITTGSEKAAFEELREMAGGYKALTAAFSTAVLDWWTKKQGISVSDYFGTIGMKAPQTSFTIAIGDLDLIPRKIEEARPYPILKVKLGTADDKEIINRIRQETDKTIRVDANEGWTLDQAREMIPWLADRNVELVEQPLKADNIAGTAALKRESPLPLIADENSIMASDIPGIADAFHGINIKLMKCGSLQEAFKMIQLARHHDLQIMFGCMVESSVGITSASHLSPLVDYADLDGHILIDNDPYQGTIVRDGHLILPEGPGLGVHLKTGGIPNLK